MTNITRLLYRVLGVIIFISAITSCLFVFKKVRSEITVVKQKYANDSVYSEASLETVDESIISRDEMIAMLLRNPESNILVRDSKSHYTIEILTGVGSRSTVNVKHTGDAVPDGEETTISFTFEKGEWNLDQFELDTWLQSSDFEMQPITYSDGSVSTIMYYGGDLDHDEIAD